MPTPWIALLRGINVGGRRSVPMAELRATLGEAGCGDVRTYIQSGNVALRRDGEEPEVARLLVRAISARFGFEVPVAVRSVDALERVLRANPFPEAEAHPTRLHVGFLLRAPDPAAVAALDPDRSPDDRFRVVGREVFVHYAYGPSRSRFGSDWFDRQLGCPVTFRNWRTLTKLRELAG